MMVSDRLLSELERQDKYLDKLPPNFEFPLFNAKTAVESQRQNGYRGTASAVRELVDNALEAGATRIDITFERAGSGASRADSVSAVAVIDNGAGMSPKMARYALSWGGGTHFDDSDFIGKFGFGLPNASINQTRRVEVYTRAKGSADTYKAWLDLDEVSQFGIQRIPEPATAELPKFVQKYLKTNGLTFDHGTVVVWVKPDRLTYRTGASLKEHLLDDFGVTYRYLLDTFELNVEGIKVEVVDPLFLDHRGRYYLPADQGGAMVVSERVIPVRYYRDPDTGGRQLTKVEDPTELDANDKNLLAVGNIAIKIARFPYGFAAYSKGKKETDAHRRFDIRQNRRGMTFVRAGREIETVDAFPRSKRDQASGLGQWPLLQGYAYHWGVEVKFEPALDEVFGITNDKQRVRPLEDFWRLLSKEEVDRQLRAENAWQMEERAKHATAAPPEPSEQATPGESAAAAVITITGKTPRVPDHERPEAKKKLDDDVAARASVTKESLESAAKAIEDEKKRRPYMITFMEDAKGPFYEPEWRGTQIVVKINKSHPLFDTLYSDLLQLPGGRRAKEAVDVLLISLGRAELITEDETAKLWYQRQRSDVWSPFLSDALKVLAQTLRPNEEPEQTAEVAVA